MTSQSKHSALYSKKMSKQFNKVLSDLNVHFWTLSKPEMLTIGKVTCSNAENANVVRFWERKMDELCNFCLEKIRNLLLEFIFYSKAIKTFNFRVNRLIPQGGTKKTPPPSWSTRVNQEGGGAQIFIKAKNGKGQTQFWANLAWPNWV